MVGTTVDDECLSLQFRGERAGFPVRQGEDDDVMAVQYRGGRRLQDAIGEIHQVRVMRAEPGSRARVRRHRPDFELGVLQREP